MNLKAVLHSCILVVKLTDETAAKKSLYKEKLR